MGLGLYFEEGEGPKFKKPITDQASIDALPIPDPESDLGYVMGAVRTIRRELNGSVPLIGFSGSPWTLATYMVEGGSTKTFSKSKGMLFDQPKMMHSLLDKLADSVIAYLNGQVAAGAQSLMIFDTWGGALSPSNYEEFSLQYMAKIVAGLTRTADGRKVPVTLFTKGGGQWLEMMADTGCDALGLDWTTDMADARARVGDRVALQGNLDPCILYSSHDSIRNGVNDVLASYGEGAGHVFNLGHGIHPTIDPSNPEAMINAVHEFSKRYHK